jgi:hypothetical protein
MGFHSDLKFGKIYEEKALELFYYDTVEKPKGRFKPYDFKLTRNGIVTNIEIKADRLAYRTGNLAIEYMCSGKQSGITSTEADIWVIFLVDKKGDDRVFIFPIDELRLMAKKCRSVNGGDNWKSSMYLLPVSECSKYELIKNEDEEDEEDEEVIGLEGLVSKCSID